MIAAGRNDGLAVDDPVVTQDGLVGTISRVGSRTARVTLLTDDQSAVSAMIPATGAAGVVRPGQGPRAPLRLDRVGKEARVRVGDTVVTAGWRSQRLASIYPKGILIGRVTSVGVDGYRPLHPGAGHAVRRPRVARGSARPPAARARRAVSVALRGRAARLRRGGHPGRDDRRAAHPRRRARLLLVTVVALALVAGSLAGAVAGFAGGLLVDVMTLGTLGTTSIVLILVGLLGGAVRRDDRARPRVCAFSCRVRAHDRRRRRRGRAPLPARPVRLGSHGARHGRYRARLLAAALVIPVHRLCRRLLDEVVPYERARRVELV